MFSLLEAAGFQRVKSVVVPRFRFRNPATQSAAESYGLKAVLITASKLA